MANPKELLQLEEQRKAKLKEIYDLQTKILALEKDKAKWTSDQINDYKELRTTLGLTRKELSITATQIKKINGETTELAKSFSNIAGSIGSLSELQEDFKKQLVKTSVKAFDLGKTIGEAGDSNKEKYQQAIKLSADLIDINARLGALTKEDELEKIALQQEYAEKFDTIKEISSKLLITSQTAAEVEKQRAETLASITGEIEKGHKEAEQFANVDKEHSEFLKELSEDYHNIGKALKKVSYTAETIFGSKRGLIGMGLIAAGAFAEKMHEIGREMGYGMTQMVGFKTQVMLASMLLDEAAGESVVELGKELGNVNHQTLGMSTDVAMLSYHLKLSGQEAAYLSTAFGELQGKSWETGMNMVKYGEDLAFAKGVMPSQAMKDVAQNSEFLAKFTHDGGKNIMEAAVAAGQLGVNLGTAEKMADSLLDYQSSIDAEMEASALLGRNLNLNKARELMYQGKIAEGMDEALKAAGGIEGWNKMDYYQRRLTAKALGVSEGEMQKMVAHQENLNGKNGIGAEIYERSSMIWHTMVDSMAGKGLKAMGGLVLSGAQLGAHLNMMGIKFPALTNAMNFMMKPINAIVSGLGSMVSWIGKAIAKMLGLKAAQSAVDGAGSMAGPLTKAGLPDKRFKANKTPAAAATPPPAAPGGDQAGQASKFSKINPMDMIKAAAALLIIAAAVWVFAKALQEFASVDFGAALMGIGLLVLLAGVAVLLGMVAGLLIMGAIGLAAVSIALLIFGAAVNVLGAGMILLGEGLQSIATGINDLDVGKLALFGLALIPLALGMAFFGLFAPVILLGVIALLMLGQALAVLAPNLSLMAMVMPSITASITPLVGMMMQIFGLAAAITTLAISLAMLGTMGALALPVLAALGNGGLLSILGIGGEKKGESSQDKLLAEIVGLRKDLNEGKVSVHLDGKKVNTGLAINQRRNTN